MRRFGLIGYPLTSSFSKQYFAQKFAAENIHDCVYESYPLKSINEFEALLSSTDLEGLNVTIPFKKEVIRYLTDSTDAVKKMGACNCIKIKNGKLTGYNTDVAGFQISFVKQLLSHHKKALILGTGGASAAIEYVLDKLNIPYLFVTRDVAGKTNAITYHDLDEQYMNDYQVIINTSPVGMAPDTSAPAIPYQFVTANHYLYDLVYNPAETSFLKEGHNRGATTKNGEEMLIIQADESWKIWNEE